jgi:hypothetical protein
MTGSLHEANLPFDHISFGSSYNEKCFRKSFRENQKTHFMFNNCFENRTFYEMWKNILGADRQQMTI